MTNWKRKLFWALRSADFDFTGRGSMVSGLVLGKI